MLGRPSRLRPPFLAALLAAAGLLALRLHALRPPPPTRWDAGLVERFQAISPKIFGLEQDFDNYERLRKSL